VPVELSLPIRVYSHIDVCRAELATCGVLSLHSEVGALEALVVARVGSDKGDGHSLSKGVCRFGIPFLQHSTEREVLEVVIEERLRDKLELLDGFRNRSIRDGGLVFDDIIGQSREHLNESIQLIGTIEGRGRLVSLGLVFLSRDGVVAVGVG